MTAAGRTGSFWPSPTQCQLLAVALGSDDALEVWRRLRPTLDLDNLEPGTFALLPLVYQTLAENGSEDSLLPRLKGIYRNTWVRANLLLERTAATAEVLAERSVRPLFLGGTLVAERFYPNLALRPTPSVELLVDIARRETATAALPAAGWTPRPDITEGEDGPLYFSDRDNNICVLRTALAFDFALGGDAMAAHAPLWESAEPYRLRSGVEVLAPATTDALLAAVVLGARKKPTPGLHWVLDAVMILRHAAGSVDWQRLLNVGVPRGQATRLREGLEYVAELPGAAVPTGVLERLSAVRATAVERLVYTAASGAGVRLGALPEIFAEHLVACAGSGRARMLVSFPERLRRHWGLRSKAELPLAVGKRAFRHAGGPQPR